MLATHQHSVQSRRPNSNLRVCDKTIAILFGSDAAILLNRINHWLSLGYGIEHEGKRYWYATYKEIAERELDWLSPSQVKRLIQKLIKAGILLVKRLQSHLYRQTNHYRINWSRLKELLSNSGVLSNGRDRLLKKMESTNDLYTEITTEKTGSEEETNSIKETNEQQTTNKQNQTEQIAEETEPLEQADQEDSNIRDFHNYLIIELARDPEINHPEAYAQKIVSNLLAGSPSSKILFNQWKKHGECNLSSSEVNPPQSSQKQPQNKQTEQEQHQAQTEELKEWQIKPEDEELLDFGYQVGDIYPEFVQWCVPRLKYHPDLTDYAAKAHTLRKLKFEPQLALELWRDFKRLLVREYEDKQKMEEKGQRYFTPAWMQLPADVPVEKAKVASVELNQAKAQEQQAIDGQRQNNQATLTAGDDEHEQTEETGAIANSEDGNDQEELTPIESVESAIALMEKHPNHPVTKGIVENIINGAKANASESELEEIKRLEDQAFEF